MQVLFRSLVCVGINIRAAVNGNSSKLVRYLVRYLVTHVAAKR